MRLITWNINSLRLRLPLLAQLTQDEQPDVICLQETKVPDPLFPADQLREMGWEHHVYWGMKGYNGVAILSRYPLEPVKDVPDWCGRSDSRHVAAWVTLPTGKVLVHNFYVPAGGDVPDVNENEKFAHKLGFLEEARAFFAQNTAFKSILVGDLNIAPREHDVWSHKQLLKVVSHTPVEVEALNAWLNTGFVDVMRHLMPEPDKLYTWWSYRNRDWKKSNRGRRLDHIWVSPDILPGVQAFRVLKDIRDWEGPSDHVPVVIDLEIPA